MCALTETIRVLHVDDESEFAEMAATFLEREDDRFEVETATTAEAGLDRLEDGGLDCVVSDYDMPGQSGIEFLEAVRRRHPNLPFILYTGKGSEEIASEAISAGVTEYLQKETGTGQYAVLANRIEKAVERHRTQAELEHREKRLNLFFEQSPLGVIEWNENFELVRINDAGAEILGYTQDDLCGRSWEAIVPESDVPDVDSVVSDLLANEGGYYSVNENVRKDGERIVCEWHNRVIADDDGDVIAVFSQFQDITEQTERKREIEAERQFISQALDALDDVFYVVGPDGELRRWNESLQEVTGYSATELSETTAVELFVEADRPRVTESIERTLQTGIDRVEADLRTRDGEAIPYQFSSRLLTDADGSVLGIAGIGRNISEQQRKRQEYERTLDLLDQTQRIADVGGWEVDPETQDVFWSDHIFEMLGWEDGDEPSLETALDVYLEEDRERVGNAIEAAVADREPFTVEARFQRSDGEIRWFDIHGEPVVEDDEVVTIRGAVQDITDRRRREEVLREMYDIVSNRHRSFEEQIQLLLELGRRELGTDYGTVSRIRGDTYVFEFVDTDDGGIRPGDTVPLSATNCELVASSEQTLVFGDIERDAPEETHRAGFTEWGISCYIGAPVFVENEVYGTFCFYDTEPRDGQFSDWEQTLVDLMSNWVSHELQRQQTNERLQKQNEQLEQFASVVSHDLRNPLNVAEGHLELARDECESEHFDAVAGAHDRMNTLIDDLLALARGGDEVGELEAIDLRSLTETCWANVDTAGAALTIDLDRSIRADRSRLQQLIENLVRNAIEHGGSDVAVTVGELTDGFYVEDTGTGIPEESRETVFTAGHSTSDGGTGFGLSIVKQVADAHGWEIRVTDGADGGARFECTGVEFTDR